MTLGAFAREVKKRVSSPYGSKLKIASGHHNRALPPRIYADQTYALTHILLVTTKRTIIAWPEFVEVTKIQGQGLKSQFHTHTKDLLGASSPRTSPENFTLVHSEVLFSCKENQWPFITTP
jgi:hypothetical protein